MNEESNRTSKPLPRYEIREGRSRVTRRKTFRVVLIGENGEPLSASETLNSRDSAVKNATAQMLAAPKAGVFDA